MTAFRGFAAGLALGALLGAVPSCGGGPCDADRCPSGCCDAQGECQAGNARSACGKRGASCATCELTEACQLGFCIGLGNGQASDGGSVGVGPPAPGDGGSSSPSPDGSVPLTFGPGCAAPASACGGALDGTYGYVAGCVEAPFVDALSLCMPSGYSAQSEGFVYGTVVWTANSVQRDGRRAWESTVQVSPACAAAYSGCAGVKSALSSGSYAPADCQETAGGGCACTAVRNGTHHIGSVVELDGGVALLGASAAWEYCVSGDQLEIRDLTKGAGRAVYRLKKQ